MSSLAIADSPAHLCYPLQRPKRPLRAAGWPRRVEPAADVLRQGEPAVVVDWDRRHWEGLRAGGIRRGREDGVRKGRPEDGSERTSTARNSASLGARERQGFGPYFLLDGFRSPWSGSPGTSSTSPSS